MSLSDLEASFARRSVTVRSATWATRRREREPKGRAAARRAGAWDDPDDVGEVGEGVDPARLAHCDERVQSGDAHAGVDVSDEVVVLTIMRSSAFSWRRNE